jgi:hypothetical protein
MVGSEELGFQWHLNPVVVITKPFQKHPAISDFFKRGLATLSPERSSTIPKPDGFGIEGYKKL